MRALPYLRNLYVYDVIRANWWTIWRFMNDSSPIYNAWTDNKKDIMENYLTIITILL